MPPLTQSAMSNRLLRRLSATDFALLDGSLEPVACPQAKLLAERGVPFPYIYFLERGIASVVVCSPEGQVTEGGLIGREGFVAPAIALGSDRVTTNIGMQVPGHGYQMERAAFVSAMHQSMTLRDTLLRFVQAMIVQTTYTALANAVHQVDERLTRWLLMCHDRSDGDDIALTHEFMSIMLSVRRPSVTNALHVLEGNGFIANDRGNITIRNRGAMEDFAGDTYGAPEAEYRRLLGPL